jgi:glycosyltransferase involved in cell wall biosynthesis
VRIVVHDYSGHPFQAQLSRELARRGHEVWHLTSADFQTPKGKLDADDATGGRLTTKALTLGEVFHKDSFVKRRGQEVAFGKLVGREIEQIRPDVVLSSNAPLDTQAGILKATRKAGARFIFWVQDLYGEAIYRILSAKFSLLGRMVGLHYKALEYRMLRASDAAVVISEDFKPILKRNGVDPARTHAIENWAPLDELAYTPMGERPAGKPVRFLYTGTLGYKHNPELLVSIAALPNVEVRVHSEGRVASELKARAENLPNLTVLPWVPFDELPATLASADVFVAMIEADAGVFSVPSKVLTYLCAGRPILASIPPENLAARILTGAGAGLVAPPGDDAGFVDNARKLAESAELGRKMGGAARGYAEATFNIKTIGDRFEALIGQAVGK